MTDNDTTDSDTTDSDTTDSDTTDSDTTDSDTTAAEEQDRAGPKAGPEPAAPQGKASTDRPRADKAKLNRIHQLARKLKRLARQGARPESPEAREVIRELLAAAAAWRESARERARALGLPEGERPRFSNPPGPTDPGNLPNHKQYNQNLRWWASRYAWDRAQGLHTGESRKRLVMTAVMGPRPRGDDQAGPVQADPDRGSRNERWG